MDKQKIKILSPQYMHNFRCIGSACEDCCCIGWLVTIDSASHKSYEKVKDAELRQLLSKSISRNRTNPSDEYYAKIKLDENNICPMLNQDKMCRLQLKLGEDYLSKTCRTFPRAINIINGTLEMSATMSCPEAARLALLNPNTIEFDESDGFISNKDSIQRIININDGIFSEKPEKYFWELRIFTITVIQNRSYKLWQRLVMLGFFFQQLQELINNKELFKTTELIAEYMQLIQNGEIREILESIPTQNFLQLKLLKEISDLRLSADITNSRYFECFAEFIKGLGLSDMADMEVVGETYIKAYSDFYKPFMLEHEYILENYLVNYVFKNLFPFTGEKSVFDSYMMLILYYSLIKMLLIGIAAYNECLTTESVIKLIQAFAKVVEHDATYINDIARLMSDNGFNKMAYMAILIKN